MGLLIQRFFVENYKRELYYWGIICIIFMFFRNNPIAIQIIVAIMGVIFAARFLKEARSASNKINFFMIPATQVEKTAIAILFSTIYYLGMMLIAYLIANPVGTLLNNLLATIPLLSNNMQLFSNAPLEWMLFTKVEHWSHERDFIPLDVFCYIFIFLQSIFLFGGIYFKNNPIPKTILSFVLFVIILIAISVIEIWIFNGFERDLMINDKTLAEGGGILYTIGRVTGEIVGTYLVIPFFWVTTYFKLTEKEV